VGRLILLNLDAELEWAGVRGGPKPRDVARWAARVPRFWATDDRVACGHDGEASIDASLEARLESTARGGSLAGYAWGSTRRALDALVRAGATPVGLASPAIAARANHRGFAAEHASGLPRAAFATSESEVRRVLEAAIPGESWWAKGAWSWAGRGRRVFDPLAPQPADEAFLAKALGAGGVQLEPRVEPLEEWALHGWIHASGAVRFGAWTLQSLDAHGQWQGSAPAPEGPGAERGESETRAERIARALVEAGYRGAFGIDGYRYRDAAGNVGWRFAGDLNARFTMGWHAGGLGLPPD
jgi:hypothetical protein